MKQYGIKSLVWVLLLAVVLSSCAAPAEQTSAPQESESTTTTTTTAEVETTTTTADTTEQPTESTTEATVTEPTTTTTTAKPTTSITTKSTAKKATKAPTKTTKPTTKKTTKPHTTEKSAPSSTVTTSKVSESTTKTTTTVKTSATTRTTYPKDHPSYSKNPPYEDKDAVPEKGKRQLLFCVNSEDILFTFEKAMREPFYDDCLLWYYRGTAKDGAGYTCVVAAEQNKIYQIDCDQIGSPSSIREDAAQVYVAHFIYDHDLSMSTDTHNISIRKQSCGAPGHQAVNWTVGFPTEYEGDHLALGLSFRNGKVCLSWLKADFSVVVEGQVKAHPYCLGDEFSSLLTPRWISE